MLNSIKSWINKEPENIEPENMDIITSLEHFGYKGKVFDIVYRQRRCNGFLSSLETVEAFDKYSKSLITERYISTVYSCEVLKFETECLKETLKNTMITSEDIYN